MKKAMMTIAMMIMVGFCGVTGKYDLGQAMDHVQATVDKIYSDERVQEYYIDNYGEYYVTNYFDVEDDGNYSWHYVYMTKGEVCNEYHDEVLVFDNAEVVRGMFETYDDLYSRIDEVFVN